MENKFLVEVPVVIGEQTFQVLEENITDLKSTAKAIISANLELKTITCEVLTDKVIVQGSAVKTVIFKSSKSNKTKVVTENISFSALIEIWGAQPGMNCQLENLKLEPVVELLTTCKLREKILVSGKVVVTQNKKAELEPIFPKPTKRPKKDKDDKDGKDGGKDGKDSGKNGSKDGSNDGNDGNDGDNDDGKYGKNDKKYYW